MIRPIARLFCVTLFLWGGLVIAQDTPLPPPTPTLAPVLVPSATPLPTPIPPTPTPLPDITGQIPNADDVGATLLAARNDLEVLANATLGITERPTGWNGSYDITNPQMAFEARLDLELIADALLSGARPEGWFGVQATSAYGTARDIRHDLELLADRVVAPSVRPPNWIGDDPLMRCNRSTQALVLLLESRGVFTRASTSASPTYCFDLMIEVSTFTELNLLDAAPPPPNPATDDQLDPQDPVTIVGANVVGYYDRAASQQAGVIPDGTIVQPVARSYAEFSRMTLVRGDGFELFIDYQDSTMPAEQYAILGDINALTVNTVCRVEWCGAPPE